MKTLAVTGGIGSGKSLVCSEFAALGVPVYDSDSRTKRLYDTDRSLVGSLESAFGCRLLDDSGTFDRARLALLVFPDEENMKKLESLVHPRVLDDFVRWREGVADSLPCWNPAAGNVPFVIIESAIILEKPLFHSVADRVLLVDAPVATRLQRACARDGASEAAVMERMARQPMFNAFSDGLSVPGVDFVIRNDGTPEELRDMVRQLCGELWK